MSEPTGGTPRASLTSAIATQLQDAHPDVPPERLPEKVGRTLLGTLFVSIGLALLGLLVLWPGLAAARTVNPVPLSLPLLFAGLGAGFTMVILGATIWSSELMGAPIAFVLATLRGVFAAVRGQSAPPA